MNSHAIRHGRIDSCKQFLFLSIEKKDLSIKDFSLAYNRLEIILCFCLKKDKNAATNPNLNKCCLNLHTTQTNKFTWRIGGGLDSINLQQWDLKVIFRFFFEIDL